MRLEGRTVLITGASSGIGAATPDAIVNNAGAGRFLFIEETEPDEPADDVGGRLAEIDTRVRHDEMDSTARDRGRDRGGARTGSRPAPPGPPGALLRSPGDHPGR